MVSTKAALERFRASAGGKQKMTMQQRDVEREMGWHDQERAKGTMTEEQYWRAVEKTLHDHGAAQE